MNTKVISAVAQWKMNSTSNDVRSRGSIVEFINILGQGKKTDRVAEFKEEGKKITSTNMRRDFNNTLNIAVAMKKAIARGYVNITHLEVATMKKIAGLMKKVENREDVSDDVLDVLSTVVGVGANYNNALCIHINKINSDIAPAVAKVSYKEASTIVGGLSKEDKEKLLATLMEELGYELEREVA